MSADRFPHFGAAPKCARKDCPHAATTRAVFARGPVRRTLHVCGDHRRPERAGWRLAKAIGIVLLPEVAS